jgi:hypothetical protein
MVELDSYSSVDWSDSAISLDKAEALKSKSPEAKMLSGEGAIQLSSLAQFGQCECDRLWSESITSITLLILP